MVLWLTYASGSVDAGARTVDDFRAAWATSGSTPADYPVVRVTGQPGMANGGGRGVRVVDAEGAAVSWSFYPTGSVSAGTSPVLLAFAASWLTFVATPLASRRAATSEFASLTRSCPGGPT